MSDPSTLAVGISPALEPWHNALVVADAFYARARRVHEGGDRAEAERLRDIADAKYDGIDREIERSKQP